MARKMMTLMGIFDELSDAENGIAALKSMAVPEGSISVLAHQGAVAGEVERERGGPDLVRDANGTVATTAGLTLTLVGIVLCAIPLAGLLTAGPLAVLGGAASLSRTGNPVDDLVELGVDREDAKLAHECLRRGSIVVVATCDRTLARRAADAMARAGAIDFRKRADEWEREGWEYEPNAPMWSREKVADARALHLSDGDLLPVTDLTPTAV